jgi:hypothetical protein
MTFASGVGANGVLEARDSMSDIFISYASVDRARAAALARALQARGWSVWWDRTIPPGRQFDEVIEEALNAAGCVVVLWSKTSTASSWVKTEAAEAMRRKALIPAMIEEDVKIPLEFRRLQAANLAGWHGEASTPEFEQFCTAIAGNVGPLPPAPAPSPTPPAPPAPRPSPPPAPRPAPPPPPDHGGTPAKRSRSKTLYIALAVVAGVVVGVTSMVSDDEPAALPQPVSNPAFLGDAAPGQSPGRGIHMNLGWRDYVLAYTGNLSWDGSSNTALIAARIVDGNTGQMLGNQQLRASVSSVGSGRYVFSTRVPVPGDSQTAGPHTHDVNLIFQAQPNGGWMFVQNCMTPTNCY